MVNIYIYVYNELDKYINEISTIYTDFTPSTSVLLHVSAKILSMSGMWKNPGILFPSLEKVGSTLYEMVSQNAEKFHLEDRKHGFLSCTLRAIGAPNPTIFPYEGLVKPPISLLKCAAKLFVFSQLSCSERILEIEVAWFKEKWTKMFLGRLGMVQWFLPLHLQA